MPRTEYEKCAHPSRMSSKREICVLENTAKTHIFPCLCTLLPFLTSFFKWKSYRMSSNKSRSHCSCCGFYLRKWMKRYGHFTNDCLQAIEKLLSLSQKMIRIVWSKESFLLLKKLLSKQETLRLPPREKWWARIKNKVLHLSPALISILTPKQGINLTPRSSS